jgi:hypothetical protein
MKWQGAGKNCVMAMKNEKFLLGTQKGMDRLEDVGVDGNVILS